MNGATVQPIDGLPEAIDRLVRDFDPIRIILFGSWARGDARPDSDVDLLVVLPRMAHKRHALAAMLDSLEDVRVEVDPIPTDLDEIARRGDLAGDILRPALREGKVVYERVA
jgi:predicted nucleotidyltransferase